MPLDAGGALLIASVIGRRQPSSAWPARPNPGEQLLRRDEQLEKARAHAVAGSTLTVSTRPVDRVADIADEIDAELLMFALGSMIQLRNETDVAVVAPRSSCTSAKADYVADAGREGGGCTAS